MSNDNDAIVNEYFHEQIIDEEQRHQRQQQQIQQQSYGHIKVFKLNTKKQKERVKKQIVLIYQRLNRMYRSADGELSIVGAFCGDFLFVFFSFCTLGDVGNCAGPCCDEIAA